MWLLGRDVPPYEATVQVRSVDVWLDYANIQDEADVATAERLIDDPSYRVIIRDPADISRGDIYYGGMWEYGKSFEEFEPERVFIIQWTGQVSWAGRSLEEAIENFKKASDFAWYIKVFSQFGGV